MEIIGLSGYARSGKDEAAKVLVEEFGFTRVAFADKLREVLYALNPKLGSVSFGQGTSDKEYRVRDFIDKFGWDGYKENDGWHNSLATEVRELLQRLGTEAGRQTLWDSIWVDAALTGHSDDARLVVTDCRFPNEAEAIKAHGGQVWRVVRKGVGPANSHPSETSLDDWKFDKKLMNYGTVEEYHDQIRSAYEYS